MTDLTLLVFAVVAFIGIATPGPTVLLALTNGSRFGVKPRWRGMVGAVLSDFVLISAVALGLGALLAASEFWFSVVKWIGVAYLAYLGILLLRSSGTLAVPRKTAFGTAAPSSAAIFFAASSSRSPTRRAICSSRRSCRSSSIPSAPQLPQYAALAVMFAAIDFAVMLGYALHRRRAACGCCSVPGRALAGSHPAARCCSGSPPLSP